MWIVKFDDVEVYRDEEYPVIIRDFINSEDSIRRPIYRGQGLVEVYGAVVHSLEKLLNKYCLQLQEYIKRHYEEDIKEYREHLNKLLSQRTWRECETIANDFNRFNTIGWLDAAIAQVKDRSSKSSEECGRLKSKTSNPLTISIMEK